jgi:hypothetical protein
MTILKIQTWLPDTHPGHVVEVEWEYDLATGRDTGREHRGVSVRYPDGVHIHRDTHGADAAQQHYKKLHAEHVVKNQAFRIIAEALPAHMKRPVLGDDGNPLLDDAGQPRLAVRDNHRPSFNHLGNGSYAFTVPGMDEATHRAITAKLAPFDGNVVLLKSA